MSAEKQQNLYDTINKIEDQEDKAMQDKLDAFLKSPESHRKIRTEVMTNSLNQMNENPKEELKNAAIALMEFTYPGDEGEFKDKTYDEINWFVNDQYNNNLPQNVQDRGKREGALYSLVHGLEGKGVLQANKVSTQIAERKEQQQTQQNKKKKQEQPQGSVEGKEKTEELQNQTELLSTISTLGAWIQNGQRASTQEKPLNKRTPEENRQYDAEVEGVISKTPLADIIGKRSEEITELDITEEKMQEINDFLEQYDGETNADKLQAWVDATKQALRDKMDWLPPEEQAPKIAGNEGSTDKNIKPEPSPENKLQEVTDKANEIEIGQEQATSAPENIAIKQHTETMRAREAQRSIDSFLGGLIRMPNENGEYDPQDAELTDNAKDTLRMGGIFNKKKAKDMASGLASLGQLTQQAKTFEEKTKILHAAMEKMSKNPTSIFTEWKLEDNNTLIGIVATKKSGKERRIQRNSREQAVSAQVWKIKESRDKETQKLQKDAYKRDVQTDGVDIDTTKTEAAEELYDETQAKSQEKQKDMLNNMSDISTTLTEFSNNMTKRSALEAKREVTDSRSSDWKNIEKKINDIQQQNIELTEKIVKQRESLQEIDLATSLEATMANLEGYITSIDVQQQQVNDNISTQVEENLEVARDIKNGLLEKVKNTSTTKDNKEKTYSDLLNTITTQANEGRLDDEVWDQKEGIEQNIDQLQQQLDGYAIEEMVANQRVIYTHLAGHRRAQEVTDQKLSVIDGALENVRINKDEAKAAETQYIDLVISVSQLHMPDQQKKSMLSGLADTVSILSKNVKTLEQQEETLTIQKDKLEKKQEQIGKAIDKSQQYINLLSNYTDLSVSQQRLENMEARQSKNKEILTNVESKLFEIQKTLTEQTSELESFKDKVDFQNNPENVTTDNLHKLSEFSTTISSLKSQKDAYQARKTELKSASENLAENITQLQANIDSLQQRIEEGEKQVDKLAWDQQIYQPIDQLDQNSLDEFYADVKPPQAEQVAVSDGEPNE